MNFPNNPTGKIIDAADFTALARLCDERGIHLFSDEVYRGLERDPARTLPQAADLSERGTVAERDLQVPGAAGAADRLDHLPRPGRCCSRLERAKHYTTICNSAPSEVLARIAIKARETILDRNRALIAANLPAFDAFFAEFADVFEWRRAGRRLRRLPPLPRRRTAWRGSAPVWWRRPASCCCPRASTAPNSPPTPADRFRIGIGRAQPRGGPGRLRRSGCGHADDAARLRHRRHRAGRHAAAGPGHRPRRADRPRRGPHHACRRRCTWTSPKPTGTATSRPGWITGAADFTVKIATGFYGNPAQGLPTNHGLVCVVSARTGQVRAVLDDRGLLTAWRTAAAGALITHAMARPDASDPRRLRHRRAGPPPGHWLAGLRPIAAVLVHGRTRTRPGRCATGLAARGLARPARLRARRRRART